MRYKNKHFKIILCGLAGILVLAGLPVAGFRNEALAYSGNCVTQKCREAADNAAAAQAKNVEASKNLKDAESALESKRASIAAKEASIASQEAMVEDLAAQITEKTAKIETDQKILADVYVEMHFTETPSAISLLANSGSLGDYADKQSRQDTIQERMNSIVRQLNEEKAEVESKKETQTLILNGLTAERDELAQQKADLESAAIRYQNDADAFAKDAEKALSIVQQEELAWANEQLKKRRKAPTGGGGGGGSTAAGNTYPDRGRCPWPYDYYSASDVDEYNWGYYCQCTSYAGWKATERWGVVPRQAWGNASSWASSARKEGYRVDWTPAPHTIAVSADPPYGHVRWVESVNANGSINISEYNYNFTTDYHTDTIWPQGIQFIHFD